MRMSSALLSYLTFVLVGRYSSVEVYGQFALLVSVTGTCGGLATFGQAALAFRHLPTLFASNDPRIYGIVREHFTKMLFGLVAFTALAVVLLTRTNAGVSIAVLAVATGIVVATALAEYLFAFYRSSGSLLVSMFGKEILWRLLLIGAIVAAIAAGRGIQIEYVASALFISTVGSVVLFSVLALSRLRQVRRADRESDLPDAAWQQSFVFFGLIVLSVSNGYIDPIILGMTDSNPVEIGAYFSAARTTLVLYFFSYSFGVVMTPAVVIAFEASRLRDITRMSLNAAYQGGGMALLAGAVMFVASDEILALFNPAFRPYGFLIRILCIGPVIYNFFGLHHVIPPFCGAERAYVGLRLGVFFGASLLKVAAAYAGQIVLFAWLTNLEVLAVIFVGVILADRKLGIPVIPFKLPWRGLMTFGHGHRMMVAQEAAGAAPSPSGLAPGSTGHPTLRPLAQGPRSETNHAEHRISKDMT
jgi:O-antigen/teichoic acid export membrane protein